MLHGTFQMWPGLPDAIATPSLARSYEGGAQLRQASASAGRQAGRLNRRQPSREPGSRGDWEGRTSAERGTASLGAPNSNPAVGSQIVQSLAADAGWQTSLDKLRVAVTGRPWLAASQWQHQRACRSADPGDGRADKALAFRRVVGPPRRQDTRGWQMRKVLTTAMRHHSAGADDALPWMWARENRVALGRAEVGERESVR